MYVDSYYDYNTSLSTENTALVDNLEFSIVLEGSLIG